MQMQTFQLRSFAIAACAAILAFSGVAGADPPSRVARLGYVTGEISFSPAGENDWARAAINRPLTTGDRLWADNGARAEIQVGGAMIRMNAGTGVSILNLDDRIAQLQLTQGTLNVRVRRLEPNQAFEVDTPNLAFTLRQPGEFRITVDADGNATEIVVRKGQGEVYGEGAAYVIDSRQPYRFTGTGLREYDLFDAPRQDEFDRWSSDRDRSYDNSTSARYVSQDVVGYQDLDANGVWRVDATYGNVWVPTRVAADWAPYRDGHWAWVDPWGWTWVDDAPWGFAVSHYGRWTNMQGTWGWVPGPVRTRAYYAPALVAFVGGSNFQIAISSGNVGGVAWFPLGPREVYRPSYAVSRGYFENVNRSNTVVNNTVINNYYNNSNVTNVVYANRQVAGAVVAVPTTTFVQSQPVGRAAVRVAPATIANASVAVIPSVAPTQRSVQGAATGGDRPPPRVFERSVVARTAPPAATVGFAAQQQQLVATKGKPLDDNARRELKPDVAAPVPVVNVIAPAKISPPAAAPPRVAAGTRQEQPGKSGQLGKPEQTGKPEQPGKSDQRGQAAIPPPTIVPAPAPAPAQAPRIAPGQQPPSQVEPPAPRIAPTQQPAPPPTLNSPPQRGMEPRPVQPQIAPPPVVAQPPEQRGRPDQRGQPSAPPPERAAEPKPMQPQIAPPPVVAQPPEQRGRQEQRGQPPALPPSQQAVEPKPVQPMIAPAPPVSQPPQQRVAPPPTAQPRQPAPAAPAAAPSQPPANLVPPPPSAKPPETRAPVAKTVTPPPAAPQVTPNVPPQSAPNAPPRGQEAKPATGKPDDKKKDADELKREEELRKQKG